MKQEQFFHLCGQRLGRGSTIVPGNWGRIVRAAGWAHTGALREAALDAYRIAYTPSLPSRLDSAFVFLSAEDALQFKSTTNGGFSFHSLHRVRLVDESAKCFVTDWRFVDPHGTFEHWPNVYWKGLQAGPEPGVDQPVAEGPRPCYEMLTLSHLLVEECLD